MFLLEQGSGPCRALALALQCLILLDHVGVQQGLQACVPVAGSLGQDRLIRPALSSRTDRRLALLALVSAKKIDGVPVFDTGATNLFTVVPTLTVPDRWIFPRIEGG